MSEKSEREILLTNLESYAIIPLYNKEAYFKIQKKTPHHLVQGKRRESHNYILLFVIVKNI